MKKSQKSLIGFALTHKTVIYFEGIFQVRLATDSDVSEEKRGIRGWTFAHNGEPNLDRIIRFNHPVAERICADAVGVKVTRINQDGLDIQDPLIGQQVNLGPQSFFDGSHGAGDGREPIEAFSFHVGDKDQYISVEAQETPRGTGVVDISPELKKELGVDDMDKWRKRRIEALNSMSFTPDSIDDILRKERIEKINSKKGIRGFALGFSVRYPSDLDKNLKIESQSSKVVEKLKRSNIDKLFFNADFYNFDADGLTGHVKGTVTAVVENEKQLNMIKRNIIEKKKKSRKKKN